MRLFQNRTLLRRMGIVFGIFVLFTVGFWVIAWRASERALDEAKEKFTAVAREHIPEFETLPPIHDVSDTKTEAEKAYFEWFESGFERFDPESSNSTELIFLHSMLRETPVEEWEDAGRERLDAFLTSNEDLLQQAAGVTERFPVPENRTVIERILNGAYDRWIHYDTFARLALLEAIRHRLDDEHPEALDDVLLALELVAAGSKPPAWVGYFAIADNAIDILESVAALYPDFADVPEEDFLRIQDAVRQMVPPREELTRMTIEALAPVRLINPDSPVSPSDFVEAVADSAKDRGGGTLVGTVMYATPFGAPMRNHDVAYLFQEATRVVRLADEPLIASLESLDSFENLDSIFDLFALLVPMRPISQMFHYQLGMQVDYYARLRAHVDLFLLGSSLERNYSDTSYPDDLSNFTRQHFEHEFVDPFSNEPYRYEAAGDSFLLYSVSTNRVDDGGTETNYRGQDFVWRSKSD